MAGLTPMVTYSFRVSVTDSKGPDAWSQVVALLVLGGAVPIVSSW